MKTFKEYLTELTDYQKKFIDGFVNLSDDDIKKFKKWINDYKQAFKKLIQYFKTHKIDKTEITSYEGLQKYLDIAEIEATTKPESKLSHLKDEYDQFEIIEDVKGNKYYTFIPYSLRASCEIASSKIGDVLGRWCVAECKNEDGLGIWVKYTLGEYKGYMMFIKPILRKTKEAYIRGDHKKLGKVLHDKDDYKIENVNSVFDSKTINYIDSVLKQNEKKIEENYVKFILRDIKKENLDVENLYNLSLNIENIDFIKELENLIIKKDKDGKWCYYFARNIKEVNIQRLQNEVMKKDKTGKRCYLFAKNIKGADIKKLENVIIERDKEGKLCYLFARDVEGANIQKLQDTIIKKDKTGYWCYGFAEDIKGADISKLEDAVIKKSERGDWCYYFARDVEGANINNILQKMKKKFGENNEFYKKILKLKGK